MREDEGERERGRGLEGEGERERSTCSEVPSLPVRPRRCQ